MSTAAEIRDLLTPEQAAEYLQVNRETIYRYIRDGKLSAARLGRHYRIPRRNVERLVLAGLARSDHAPTTRRTTASAALFNGNELDAAVTGEERPSDVARRLAVVRGRYQFRGEAAVSDYLERNPDLLGLLIEASDVIPNYFGPDASVALKVYSHPDYFPEPELFAIVRTNLPSRDALQQLRRFDLEWGEQAMEPADARLLFTI